MAKRPPTVLQACVRQLGVHRGAIAAAQAAQWAITTAELGRFPTNIEYCEYWAINERTGYNHRATLRAVFGDDWKAVVESIAERAAGARSPGRVVKVRVPAGAVPAA